MSNHLQKRVVIRGLTLYQPWAWAVAAGKKTIENRTWKPWAWLMEETVETWIAIHAGSTYEKKGLQFLTEKGVALSPDGSRTKGAILGIGRLVGCVTQSTDPMFFGPYGWVLSCLRLLQQPLFMPGSMGLWELPKEHEAALLSIAKHNPNQGDLFGGSR